MKNITLSADESLIKQAREEARKRNTNLNVLFRQWLSELAQRDEKRKETNLLFEEFDNYQAGGPYTRDEMNER